MTERHQTLGFIRKPIAHRLAARIERGAVLPGQVAIMMGEHSDPNGRVYVEVEADGHWAIVID